MRPLLFLDVDGPLIPFGGNVGWYPQSQSDSNPLLGRLNPRLGPLLLALPCDLVWATTWMDDANEVIGPPLGLPELPVVHWPDEDDASNGLHWKTRSLITWAQGRPFVWAADEISEADDRWISLHHNGRALAHRVEARDGITEADLNAIAQWIDGL